MIYEEIVDELRPLLKSRILTNICVGISYTVSLLDDGSAGLSHTVPEGEVPNAGDLLSMTVDSIISLDNKTPISRAVVLSILSSYIDNTFAKGDPLSVLEGGKLCLFGYSPVVDDRKFDSVVVYDFFNPQPQTRGKTTIRPYSSFEGEKCTHAVIYGSALVNGEIERILSKVDAENLVMSGVSSVYAERTLKKHGFTLLGKVMPVERNKALRVACEGGDATKMSKYVIKVFKRL